MDSKTEQPVDLKAADLIPMLVYPDELDFLSSALLSHGAAYIVNPPLPANPFPTARDALFSLPLPSKIALRHSKSTVRGYGAQLEGGREWWDYTPETNVADRLAPTDEKFNAETEAYFQAGVVLLAECLDVLRRQHPEIPLEASEPGLSTIRYLRYSSDLINASQEESSPTPGRNASQEESSPTPGRNARMLAHTDHGSLTLMTSNVLTPPSGLYIYSPTGTPYAAPSIENTVIIIAGDCMAHWTRGEKRILPTPHEVVLAHPDSPDEERISLAVFMRPGQDVLLSDGHAGYRMTYGQWAAGKGHVPGRRCWLVGRKQPQASSGSKMCADANVGL